MPLSLNCFSCEPEISRPCVQEEEIIISENSSKLLLPLCLQSSCFLLRKCYVIRSTTQSFLDIGYDQEICYSHSWFHTKFSFPRPFCHEKHLVVLSCIHHPAPAHTSTNAVTTPSITATTHTHTPFPRKSRSAEDRTCLSLGIF